MACTLARTFATILVVAATGAPPLIAQQPAPTFEVTSVKPNTSGANGQSSQIGKGSLTLTNMRVRAMVVLAFGIRQLDRIVGAPSWIEQDRFDVAARAPADTPDNQLRPMLRTLLAERFRLVAHTEMRDYPVYALVVARAAQGLGPNLKPSTVCDPQLSAVRPCTVITGSSAGKGAYITGGARTIGALVDALQGLQGLVDRPVVDRTRLTGTYDFDLRFSPAGLGAASPDTSNLPSIFTALQEQLGLKLEAARGLVEVLVIDSVERPTPD